MAQTVPDARVDLVQVETGPVNATAISRSVRGVTWAEAARLQCWLAGRGASVVPCHTPFATIGSTQESAFRYWVPHRFATARYAAHLVMESTGTVAVSVNGGTAANLRASPRSAPVAHTVYSDRSSLATTEAEIEVKVTSPSGVSVTVHSIAIEAVPRTELLVANDLGVERTAFFARQPITLDPLQTDLLAVQNEMRNEARRIGLFQFSRGTLSPWTTTSGTPADMLADGVSVLGRKLYTGQTSTTHGGTVHAGWSILAKCSDGTTAGAVRLNNTSGGTAEATLSVPTGTTDWTWFHGDFACNAEDNTSSYGYASDTPDLHNFDLARSAGAGTLSVATVSLYEPRV